MLAPRGLFSQVCQRNSMFSEFGQQDAQELFSLMMNSVHREFKLKGHEDLCPIDLTVGGEVVVTIKCHGCHSVSRRRERFFELSVPVRDSVHSSISAMLQPQLLSGEDAYACENCHRELYLLRERQRQQADFDDEERERRLAELAVTNRAGVGVDEVVAAPLSSSSSDDDDGEDVDEDDGGGHQEQDESDSVVGRRLTTAHNAVGTSESTTGTVAVVASKSAMVAVPSAPRDVSRGGVPASPTPPAASVAPPAVSVPPAASLPANSSSSAAGSVLSDATMSHSIANLKSVVVVHFKRFRLNVRRMRWEKDASKVKPELRLDISEFLEPPSLPPGYHQLMSSLPRSVPVETAVSVLAACDGNAEMALELLLDGVHVDNGRRDSTGTIANRSRGGVGAAAPPVSHPTVAASGASLSLVGVVEHLGGCDGGHYVAYVKSAMNAKWYRCSDSSLTGVSVDQVVDAEPYMLFYERE